MVTAPPQNTTPLKSNNVVVAIVLTLVAAATLFVAVQVYRKYIRLILPDPEAPTTRSSAHRQEGAILSKYHIDLIPLERYGSLIQKKIWKYTHDDSEEMGFCTVKEGPNTSASRLSEPGVYSDPG